MSGTIGSVAVVVSAEVSKFVSGMSSAASSTKSLDQTVTSAIGTIGKLAVAAAGIGGFSQLMKASDTWTKFNNRITTATASLGTYQATQEAVFAVSQEIRSSIDDVGASYGRLQAASANLGYSQEDTLKVTKGLIQSFKASGASSSEAASTVLQLGQALGKGKLDGDELKAVMEASVPVSDAIARAFGVQRGELKQLGEQGKLSSEIVFKGLLAGADQFNASFKNLSPTFAEAFTVLENSSTRAIGVFSDFANAPSAVADALAGLGKNIDYFSNYVESGAFGQLTGVLRKQWNNLLGSDLPGMLSIFTDVVGTVGKHIGENFSRGWYLVIPTLKAVIQELTVQIAAFVDGISAELSIAWEMLFNPTKKDELSRKLEEIHKASAQVKEDAIASIWAERDASVKASEDEIAASKAKLAAYMAEVEARKLALGSPGVHVPPPAKEPTKEDKKASADAAKHDTTVTNIMQGLTAGTEAMQAELAKRQQILAIYKQNTLAADAPYYTQQLNDIKINEALKQAEIDAAYAKDLAAREQKKAENLMRVGTDRQAIAQIIAQYDQQEILAETIKQQQLTGVQEEAQAARAKLRELEKQSAISTALGLGQQLMSVVQGQSKKAFDFAKNAALVSATIDGYKSATAAWSAGMATGGPWAPLVAASYTAASLLKTGGIIQGIRSTNFNGGGGGGATAGGGGAAPAAVPTGGGGGASSGGGGGGGPQSGNTMHTNFVGDFFNGSAVEKIAKGLVQFQKDGGTVVFSS
jgi:tape measure domain-containing protein